MGGRSSKQSKFPVEMSLFGSTSKALALVVVAAKSPTSGSVSSNVLRRRLFFFTVQSTSNLMISSPSDECRRTCVHAGCDVVLVLIVFHTAKASVVKTNQVRELSNNHHVVTAVIVFRLRKANRRPW